MPLSSDPDKRAAQLANLRPVPENLVPGAGASKPGEARALDHGGRTSSPQRSPEWSPVMQLVLLKVDELLGHDLRDQDGNVPGWAQLGMEPVCIQKIANMRFDRHVADLEARGKPVPTDLLEQQARLATRYENSLKAFVATARERIETQGAAIDLAQLAAQRHRERADVEATAEETGA